MRSEKIGVGIITCGRPDMYKKLEESLRQCDHHIDVLYVFEDTKNDRIFGDEGYVSGSFKDRKKQTRTETLPTNIGVGAAKNRALSFLLDVGCEHIFLIEDDMFIKKPDVFRAYINASKKSGIQHFNFSQHGFANKVRDNMGNITPNPKITVEYDDVGVSFYQHCVGSFSYYSRKCLDDVGLMDERYYNACEHVDHTYEIIKKGYHPPFWWFADIKNSWEYIGDDGWSIESSSICSSPSFVKNVENADKVFFEKYGHFPTQTASVEIDEFGKSLKEIKKKWTI